MIFNIFFSGFSLVLFLRRVLSKFCDIWSKIGRIIISFMICTCLISQLSKTNLIKCSRYFLTSTVFQLFLFTCKSNIVGIELYFINIKFSANCQALEHYTILTFATMIGVHCCTIDFIFCNYYGHHSNSFFVKHFSAFTGLLSFSK